MGILGRGGGVGDGIASEIEIFSGVVFGIGWEVGILGRGGGVGDGIASEVEIFSGVVFGIGWEVGILFENSCSHKFLVNAAATNPLPAKPPNINICLLVLLF